jgi:hypothetical protein
MSPDRVLVMFFYMRLVKHVCNAMSHDLLLGLAVVSFAHLIISTHSSDLFSFLGSDSKSCRTSFAGDSSPIPDDIVYFVIQPESKGIRNSFAGGIYPIPDDIRGTFDSRLESECRCTSFEDGFFSFLED